MKVWELSSLCRVDRGLIRRVWGGDQRFGGLVRWFYEDINRLVDTQDRVILDAELPDEFVIEVLKRLKLSFYLGVDDSGKGYIRSWRFAESDRELTAIETYLEFGNILEEVQEKTGHPV